MNIQFPLTPKMWQEWTKDEISLSMSSFADIEKLYDRGVEEYLSIDLWLDYVNYVKDHIPTSPSKMRALFKRAIAAGGLHVTEGRKLWSAYRKYEIAILSTMNDDDDEKKKQVEHIRMLFHNELSTPLTEIESTLSEYKSWEAEQGNANDPGSSSDGIPPDVMFAYERACSMYNERKQYEDQLSNAGASEADKEQVFLKYLEFEESSGDPARVQVLYERAVSVFPISSRLWKGYTSYLDRLEVPVPSVSVYERAVRNCTLVAELWVRYLLYLERIHSSEEHLCYMFEWALRCNFLLAQDYLDLYITRVRSLERRILDGSDGLNFELIRQTCKDAANYLGTKELLELNTYWAKLELNVGKDLAAARGVWEDTIKKWPVIEVWQQYITMEIEMGHINEARSLYKRCCSETFAGPGSEDICEAWIKFEEVHGTLDDYRLAVKKVTPWLKELKMLKSQEEANVKAYSNADYSSQKRKPSKMVNKQHPPAKKRKENPLKSAKSSDEEGSESQSGHEVGEFTSEKVDSGRQTGNTSSNEPRPSFYKDECTAFVSNIPLNAKEEDLHDFFSDIGGVIGIRLLRETFTNESRGMAFVNFSDNKHLEGALKKNKKVWLKKQVIIARPDPNYFLQSGGDGARAPGSSTSEKEVPKGDVKIAGGNTIFALAPRAVVKPIGCTKDATRW